MQSGLQSFVEQRTDEPEFCLMGSLYDLLWTLQDLLWFCSITFALLTVPREELPMPEEHDRSCSKLNLAAAHISGPKNSVEPSHLSLLTCDL